LTTKQIRDRLEKAGQKVVDVQERSDGVLWLLAGADRHVMRYHLANAAIAETMAASLSRQVGATAWDERYVLFVRLPAPEARQLLDQITR
jgi:hypothetical protein